MIWNISWKGTKVERTQLIISGKSRIWQSPCGGGAHVASICQRLNPESHVKGNLPSKSYLPTD